MKDFGDFLFHVKPDEIKREAERQATIKTALPEQAKEYEQVYMITSLLEKYHAWLHEDKI